MYLIFASFTLPAFFIGLIAPRVWMCFLAALVFSVLTLGFVYMIGSAILQDEKDLKSFLRFLFAGESGIAFAVAGTPVLIGHLVRRWAIAKKAN